MKTTQVITVVAVVLLLGAAAAASAQVTPQRLQLIGLCTPSSPAHPAEFSLPGLDGVPVDLRALKGKVVLLSFWASWCGPCKTEMPSMQRAYERLKGDGLEILAVDVMEDPGQAADFARQLKLSFPILTDSDETVGERYGVRALPTTYLLDRHGLVVARAVGGREWDRPETLAVLQDLLREDAPGTD